ncbi:beta-glucosidase A protein [Rutstroemia sp. NJR-2017a WRK4]|nr:beta-glucosidase A protein [Rutstroemia sp. NJR-2017a WRK4]
MMLNRPSTGALIGLLAQIRVTVANFNSANSSLATSCLASTVSPSYSSFYYEQMSTNRYATPLSTPLSLPTYAPAFAEASTLLPANVTYTTYSLDPAATSTDDGPYGKSAYAALWAGTTYSLDPPFTTTASPTPVASSELIYPPPLPVRPLNEDKSLKLPCDFIWGVASSAWQIEGGLQVEGRGPAGFDSIGTDNSGSGNDSNIADMHYFLYKQDIARLAALGVPYYSFSISWTRVMPFGVADSPVNTQALDHYEDLIKICYDYGIIPVATLVHADNPVGIFDDLDAYPAHFLYYAKQIMTRFADRVPIWFTLNEPNLAVPYQSSDYNVFSAQAKAHAEVYHWYKEEFKGTGRISTKFANNLAVPLDPSNSSHVDAAIRYQEYLLGIMANPLFLGQQIPDVVLDNPALNVTALTEEEISYINGTVDFWAFDPYVAQFAYPPEGGIKACEANASHPLWPICVATGTTQENGWLMGVQSNAYPMIAQQYVREQFGYVWNTYRPSGIMVTEFGFPQIDDSKHNLLVQQYDFERSMYYQNFLTETLHAIHSDGINVIGALAWSWIDNNEFGDYGNQYDKEEPARLSNLYIFIFCEPIPIKLIYQLSADSTETD